MHPESVLNPRPTREGVGRWGGGGGGGAVISARSENETWVKLPRPYHRVMFWLITLVEQVYKKYSRPTSRWQKIPAQGMKIMTKAPTLSPIPSSLGQTLICALPLALVKHLDPNVLSEKLALHLQTNQAIMMYTLTQTRLVGKLYPYDLRTKFSIVVTVSNTQWM